MFKKKTDAAGFLSHIIYDIIVIFSFVFLIFGGFLLGPSLEEKFSQDPLIHDFIAISVEASGEVLGASIQDVSESFIYLTEQALSPNN